MKLISIRMLFFLFQVDVCDSVVDKIFVQNGHIILRLKLCPISSQVEARDLAMTTPCMFAAPSRHHRLRTSSVAV
jgi:hypothetical protein